MSAVTRIEYIWSLTDITPAEKFILTVVVKDNKGYFELRDAIALASQVTGYTPKEVRQAFNSLVIKGYVEYDRESCYIPIPCKRYVIENIQRIAKAGEVVWPKSNRDMWGKQRGVYCLQHPKIKNLHKIGYTDGSILSRVSSIAGLHNINKDTLKIILVIHTIETRALENYLHKLFYDKQVEGEWFELESSDFDYLKSLAGVES